MDLSPIRAECLNQIRDKVEGMSASDWAAFRERQVPSPLPCSPSAPLPLSLPLPSPSFPPPCPNQPEHPRHIDDLVHWLACRSCFIWLLEHRYPRGRAGQV